MSVMAHGTITGTHVSIKCELYNRMQMNMCVATMVMVDHKLNVCVTRVAIKKQVMHMLSTFVCSIHGPTTHSNRTPYFLAISRRIIERRMRPIIRYRWV